MTDFTVNFSYPWLLLLLIPAVLIALIPYFRINKRYRRTRNRITSLILSTSVFVLCIMLLAGMSFSYDLPNTSNEIILLVDCSDTEDYSAEERDEYVNRAITEASKQSFNVGIVKFGFDQVYAVPLSSNFDDMYEKYLSSDDPDTTATDIEAAVEYAATLFTSPSTAKIVLVTDGKETDEDMLKAVSYVSSQGTRLDAVYLSAEYTGKDVQITDVTLPENSVLKDESFSIDVNIYTNRAGSVTLVMRDNGVQPVDGTDTFEISAAGTHTYTRTYTFTEVGIHKLEFSISSVNDGISENNYYVVYYNVQVFDKILLVARAEDYIDENTLLSSVLTENDLYTVTGTYFGNDDFPVTLDELREYDQVILNNISDEDMPDNGFYLEEDGEEVGFVDILYSYVYDYGGGLFTVGGSETGTASTTSDEQTAHAYSRADMQGTLYQEMLPVQAINYKPSIAVMVLVDISGSMTSVLPAAKNGIASCLNALDERDYFGVMSLESNYQTFLDLTPVSHRTEIETAISDFTEQASGGTQYVDAVSAACAKLKAYKSTVQNLHLIMITDGGIGITEQQKFEKVIADNYEEAGITLSVVVIGEASTAFNTLAKGLISGEKTIVAGADEVTDAKERLLRAVWFGNDTSAEGTYEATEEKRKKVVDKVHFVSGDADFVTEMRQDLQSEDITEVKQEDFNPVVQNRTSLILDGVSLLEGTTNRLSVTLGGFYGTKARASADVVLTTAYNVPIYAQWSFGKGKVGSFMSDLYGVYSKELLNSDDGKQLIRNIVRQLMTSSDIRSSDMSVELTEDNYMNKLSIITDLEEGERVEGTVSWTDSTNGVTETVSLNTVLDKSVTEGENAFNDMMYLVTPLSESNNYSRCVFVVKHSGITTITLNKVDAAGEIISTYTLRKAFSYSAEYDLLNVATETERITALTQLASETGGSFTDNTNDTYTIFSTFEVVIHNTFDPRTLFAILIIVLFLADVAVRKFKFKWPHEIIRNIKESKASKK